MSSTHLKTVLDKPVLQSEKIAPEQVKNASGAFVWEVDDFTKVTRFLILGSEGGTYYASENAVTKEGFETLEKAIVSNGLRVVQLIVDISMSGRAPKNDYAIFALALAMTVGNDATRSAAFAALPQVARTGTHLFQWMNFLNSQRGIGMGVRKAIARWYSGKSDQSLALQLIKYKSRESWTHKDMLRLGHPQSLEQSLGKVDDIRNEMYRYATRGWESVGETPHPTPGLDLIWAAERCKADIKDSELVELIIKYGLPMECIPSEKRSKAVYEAMIPGAGITWLIRNLGNLTRTGVVAAGQYSNLDLVVEKLTDPQIIAAGRVHPISVLMALNVYKSGHGVKSSTSWTPVRKIIDALDSTFDLSFKTIEPTGKRFVLAIDVSASMTWVNIAGMAGINPRVAAAAMSLATTRTEDRCVTMGFSHDFIDLGISSRDSLQNVIAKTESAYAARTDCALPMMWALENKVEADVFVVYTDNETNEFENHQPMVALNQYRDKMGIDAKLVVAAMTSTGFTIADPNDRGALDIVGFDSSAPNIISQFALGKI